MFQSVTLKVSILHALVQVAWANDLQVGKADPAIQTDHFAVEIAIAWEEEYALSRCGTCACKVCAWPLPAHAHVEYAHNRCLVQTDALIHIRTAMHIPEASLCT